MESPRFRVVAQQVKHDAGGVKQAKMVVVTRFVVKSDPTSFILNGWWMCSKPRIPEPTGSMICNEK